MNASKMAVATIVASAGLVAFATDVAYKLSAYWGLLLIAIVVGVTYAIATENPQPPKGKQ